MSGRVRLAVLAGAMALLLAGCATPPPTIAPARPAIVPPQTTAIPQPPPLAFDDIARAARIRDAGKRLECVVYARDLSGIEIRGDAGTWWNAALGRYDRGRRPEPGAVLAFRPTATSTGHLAVVTRIVGPRLVVASHANWLNRGRIHESTPIEDVSARGDWSSVRVWYIPGRVWGRSRYATAGFIYRRPPLTASRVAQAPRS